MEIIKLDSTPSTNTALKAMLAQVGDELPAGLVVYAENQTAGRGQRGNSWESEPGKNVTMSVLLRPDVAPNRQFEISEAVALAVADVVGKLTNRPERVKVKWPNDIFFDDLKVAGILIENSLSGDRIVTSIAGIGINLNQRRFLSDAPNPVSVAEITGVDNDVLTVVKMVAAKIDDFMAMVSAGRHAMYLSRLWRRGIFSSYREPDGERFVARITDVAPDGIITLSMADGRQRRFAFKEIAAIL